jgi:drug/metabolite transporter (DMT)-like permease
VSSLRGRTRLAIRPFAGWQALGLMLAITVLWGCGYPLSRYALTHGFDPLAFAAARFAVAAAVFSWIALRREGTVKVRRGDLSLLLLCACVGIVLNQVTVSYAFSLSAGSTVALSFGMVPVFVVVVARLLGVEVINRYTWGACAISLAGASMVVLGRRADLSGGLLGTGLALSAALTIGIYSVIVRPLAAVYSPYRLSAALAIVSEIGLLAVGGRQLWLEDWSQIHAAAWGAFLYASLGAYVLGNALYLTAIRKVGSSRASLYANMAPFAGTVLSVLVLSEPLAAVQFAGGALILAAILLAEWPVRPRVVPVD